MNNQELTNGRSYQPPDALLAASDIHFPHFYQSYCFSFKTPSEASAVAQTIATLCGVTHKNIELGLNEVFLNAIEHGNLCISSNEKAELKKNNSWHSEIEQRLNHPLYCYKSVDVIVELNPDMVTIKISDEGNGFDWKQFEKKPFSASRAYNGRGILVARSLCFDHMTFSEKGNQVFCSVYRSPHSN